MKYLFNTTALVYLSQTMPSLVSRIGGSTIREVAAELEYLLGEREARELLSATEILRPPKEVVSASKWLSDADISLLKAAKATGRVLVSDDKKLLAAARESNCACEDTPRFIESHSQLIGKEDALAVLRKLQPIYIRRKVLDATLDRVERW